ncbi:siderophore-interacting protein [Leucobacter weissii]|uniref:Siderophore-interacting protein n=1 Tax=Leucobacter weissii TaxID=1983706 RepID=A0A939SBL9_9MICO|nr:siderophore-interacting protein [Leucobacter weissii]MBO1901570.1 siderophore-interacting protein [Leucobacter weissii]
MSEGFARERVMHELRVRRLRVLRNTRIAPGFTRVTLGGEDLEDFVTLAPGDHVKVIFPDPVTRELALPEPGARGLRGDDAIVRDYTPYSFRRDAASGPELDIDFVLHGSGSSEGDGGPASAWAARAQPGDEVGIGGPRGSLLPPRDLDSAVIVADESALPAAARWLDELSDVPVTGLFGVADPGTADYLVGRAGPEHDLRWFSGDDREARVETALRELDIDEGTFLFLAGEATALIPLRRYLRRELGLSKDQAQVDGYWKRGTVALDHHAPLDPADPED